MTSIINIAAYFGNEETCVVYLEKLRWPHRVVSPFDRESPVYRCTGCRYKCRNTNKYFNVKTNTIFEGSKIPLQKWFLAIHLYAISRARITSTSLAQELDIPQRTGYSVLKKIRTIVNLSGKRELRALDNLLLQVIEGDLKT